MLKNLFNSIFSLISETNFEISLSNRSDKVKTFIDSQTSGGAPAQQSCGACKAPPH